VRSPPKGKQGVLLGAVERCTSVDENRKLAQAMATEPLAPRPSTPQHKTPQLLDAASTALKAWRVGAGGCPAIDRLPMLVLATSGRPVQDQIATRSAGDGARNSLPGPGEDCCALLAHELLDCAWSQSDRQGAIACKRRCSLRTRT